MRQQNSDNAAKSLHYIESQNAPLSIAANQLSAMANSLLFATSSLSITENSLSSFVSQRSEDQIKIQESRGAANSLSFCREFFVLSSLGFEQKTAELWEERERQWSSLSL